MGRNQSTTGGSSAVDFYTVFTKDALSLGRSMMPSIRNQAPDGGKDALSDFRQSVGSAVRRLILFWPYYFVQELLGLASERSHAVNLSDGGHIENLGVYELLRRRCRLIVASDVGADPEMEFEDLGNLMRKARIDFGVEIDLDITPLRRNSRTKLSKCHAVLGTIHYSNNEEGQIIYVKSTLIKKDPNDLHVYKQQHSAFPHESTADQFFDEAQFESYRKLGYCAGKEVTKRFEKQLA